MSEQEEINTQEEPTVAEAPSLEELDDATLRSIESLDESSVLEELADAPAELLDLPTSLDDDPPEEKLANLFSEHLSHFSEEERVQRLEAARAAIYGSCPVRNPIITETVDAEKLTVTVERPSEPGYLGIGFALTEPFSTSVQAMATDQGISPSECVRDMVVQLLMNQFGLMRR